MPYAYGWQLPSATTQVASSYVEGTHTDGVSGVPTVPAPDAAGVASASIASEPAREVPAIVYLHGIGETGGNTQEQVRRHGPWLAPRNQQVTPILERYLIVGPHLERDRWDTARLSETLEMVWSDARGEGILVDPKRVFVTGNSRGGLGALALARTGFTCGGRPERFSAALIICPENGAAPLLHGRDCPRIGFIHRRDDFNPHTRNTHGGLAGGEYHVFDGIEHDCWTAVFARPQSYDWLENAARPLSALEQACDKFGCAEAPEAEVVHQANGRPVRARFCRRHEEEWRLGKGKWVDRYRQKLREFR